MNILVVDDDAEILAVLETFGNYYQDYDVVTVGSGEAALRELAIPSSDFDLLLTDCQMPGITGPELARRVAIRYPDLPVVLMTGNSTCGPRVLQKPFDLQTLRATLDQAILRDPG